jgi:hypothetical protein
MLSNIALMSIFPGGCSLILIRFFVTASSNIGSAPLTFQLASIDSICRIRAAVTFSPSSVKCSGPSLIV